MLEWINRYKIYKETGHVTWLDVYKDTETGVEYFSLENNLSPRYNADGTLKIN